MSTIEKKKNSENQVSTVFVSNATVIKNKKAGYY